MDSRDQEPVPEAVSVAEAKRRFSELIDRVQNGDRLVVSRRGKPVMALVPIEVAGRGPARPAPLGLAAVAGALSDWDDLEDAVKEIYAERRRAKDRAVPLIVDPADMAKRPRQPPRRPARGLVKAAAKPAPRSPKRVARPGA